MEFKLHSKYKPTGDQPQAIEQLVKGFKEGNQFETLLGVTGSGKTFTMANVIQQLNKPTLIISHTGYRSGDSADVPSYRCGNRRGRWPACCRCFGISEWHYSWYYHGY